MTNDELVLLMPADTAPPPDPKPRSPGVGLLVDAEQVSLAVCVPETDTTWRWEVMDSFPLLPDGSWPTGDLKAKLKPYHPVSPWIAVPPENYRDEIVRSPSLSESERRRWLLSRQRAQPDQTVAHLNTRSTTTEVEVLELSVRTEAVMQALQGYRRLGLRAPRVTDPRLAAIGALTDEEWNGNDAVMVVEHVTPERVVLHLWQAQQLRLFRSLTLLEEGQYTWQTIAREIIRTITYFRERSRGEDVKRVVLVQTGGPEDSETGRKILQASSAFHATVRAVPKPPAPTSMLAMAARLSTLTRNRFPVNLLPEGERRRKKRLLLAWTQVSLIVGMLVAVAGSPRFSEPACATKKTILSALQDTRKSYQAEAQIWQRQQEEQARIQAKIDRWQEVLAVDQPVLTAFRILAEQLPASTQIESITIEPGGEGQPQLIAEGSVWVDYSVSVSPLEGLTGRLRSLPNIAEVRIETIASELPEKRTAAGWLGKESFRLVIDLQDQTDLP